VLFITAVAFFIASLFTLWREVRAALQDLEFYA
jgi:hypothetical protein